MAIARKSPKSIDEYIAGFSPEVQAILEQVRLTISNAAPGAQETISYQIPAFTLHGALVYFPYSLIKRIVKLRVRQNLSKAGAGTKAKRD